jgi:hypothetical protein
MSRLLVFASIAWIASIENEWGAEAFVQRTSISSPPFAAVGTLQHTPSPTTRLLASEQPPDDKKDKKEGNGALDFMFNPYENKIPKELEKEIYEAEGNTPAAKERTGRILKYAGIAFFGVLLAFFNVFLSELRNGPTPDGNPVDLAEVGFGWVQSNPVTGFLFLNKIGGGICLLGGAGSGLLAEAEFDSRRINAEKIYEELERRRSGKEKKEKRNNDNASKKKKRRSGKETKRMEALSELVTPKEEIVVDEAPKEVPAEETVSKEEKKDEGLFGKMKGFYEKADSMAASQALLMNKELEDRGVIEKITDETGLKVIGKEAASKLKDQKSEGSTSGDDTKQ